MIDHHLLDNLWIQLICPRGQVDGTVLSLLIEENGYITELQIAIYQGDRRLIIM
jgi:hypothetical protein